MSTGQVHDQPADVSVAEGCVVVDGPGALALTLSPEAAEETGRRLRRAAAAAKLQSRPCRQRGAPEGAPRALDAVVVRLHPVPPTPGASPMTSHRKQDSGQPDPGSVGAPPLPASHGGPGDEDIRTAKPEKPAHEEEPAPGGRGSHDPGHG